MSLLLHGNMGSPLLPTQNVAGTSRRYSESHIFQHKLSPLINGEMASLARSERKFKILSVVWNMLGHEYTGTAGTIWFPT